MKQKKIFMNIGILFKAFKSFCLRIITTLWKLKQVPCKSHSFFLAYSGTAHLNTVSCSHWVDFLKKYI